MIILNNELESSQVTITFLIRSSSSVKFSTRVSFHHPSNERTNEETGRFAVASRETKKITRGAGQAVFCGAECQLNGVAD